MPAARQASRTIAGKDGRTALQIARDRLKTCEGVGSSLARAFKAAARSHDPAGLESAETVEASAGLMLKQLSFKSL